MPRDSRLVNRQNLKAWNRFNIYPCIIVVDSNTNGLKTAGVAGCGSTVGSGISGIRVWSDNKNYTKNDNNDSHHSFTCMLLSVMGTFSTHPHRHAGGKSATQRTPAIKSRLRPGLSDAETSSFTAQQSSVHPFRARRVSTICLPQNLHTHEKKNPKKFTKPYNTQDIKSSCHSPPSNLALVS